MKEYSSCCKSKTIRSLVLVSIFVTTFFFGGLIRAAVYYVKVGGNDANSGLSDNLAWATVGKVNSYLFQPGDQIKFKAGDTWNLPIQCPSSGSLGNPIVFGAYGTGAKPVFDMQYVHYCNGLTCYKSYITIQDIVIKNVYGQGMELGYIGSPTYGVTIQRVELYDVEYGNAILVGGGGGEIHIDSIKIDGVANSGIAFMGTANEATRLCNTVIENCEISNALTNDGITLHKDGYGNPLGANHVIRNNRIWNCAENSIDLTASRILVEGNISHDSGEAGYLLASQDVVLRYNTSYNDGTVGYDFSNCQNVIMHHNLGYGTTSHQITILNPLTNGFKIYSNTFIGSSNGNILDFEGDIENIVTKNNIFHAGSLRNIERFMSNSRAPDYPTFSFDHNLFWSTNSDARHFYVAATSRLITLSQMQTIYNQEVNSIKMDPLFSAPGSNDYTLTLTSPAIDAGGFLTTTISGGTGTQIPVVNARYFSDGLGIGSGDTLQLEGGGTAQITSVDYANNVITVNNTLAWNADQGVSLAYGGNAPDIGAFEIDLNNGLVGYWPMDETDGPVAHDSSGHGYNGQLNNGPTWSPAGGVLGGALSFDGTNDYVQIGSISFTSPISYAVWCRPTSVTGRLIALGRYYAGCYLGIWNSRYSGCILFSSGAGQFLPITPAPVANTWVHLALTYDGVVVKYYINGEISGTSPLVGTLAQINSAWQIGADGNNGNYFAGLIDEVRLYNRTLSCAEIYMLAHP